MWASLGDEMLSHLALKRVIEMPGKKLLDVGSGAGEHSLKFAESGKEVTAIDIIDSAPVRKVRFLKGSWTEFRFKKEFDIVWCSHVLEHQLNVNIFLLWLKRSLKPDGYLAITVPPMKHQIASGHYTVWNAGLLLYNLIVAGFNCRDAQVLSYGYNISVIIKNSEIELPELHHHSWDISKLKRFFPKNIFFEGDTFFGDIQQTNWG